LEVYGNLIIKAMFFVAKASIRIPHNRKAQSMIEQHPPSLEQRTAEAVARAGLITSIIGAVIMLAVLVGNIIVISLRHVPPSWLAVIVQVGPPAVALLGFVGTGSTWYGRWRIIRRRAKYDVRDDVVDQALNAPGELQGLPRQLGCVAVVNPLLLAAGLLLCLVTFAPEPIGFLGMARNDTNHPAATPTAQVSSVPTVEPTLTAAPTATTQPTATATSIPPTATPVVAFKVSPTKASDNTTQCNADTADPVKLKLDNTGSTIAVGWSVTGIDSWAKPSASSGTVPAGKAVQLTLTITNCLTVPTNSFVDEQGTINLTSGGHGTITFMVRIFGQRLT
jgi:hypothetical protein